MANVPLYIFRYSHNNATLGFLMERNICKAFTLELPFTDTRLLPCGEYTLKVYYSQKHRKKVLLVCGGAAEGKAVEIYIGNSALDTDGFICLGYAVDVKQHIIYQSILCVKEYAATLIEWINAGNYVTLTIRNIINPNL